MYPTTAQDPNAGAMGQPPPPAGGPAMPGSDPLADLASSMPSADNPLPPVNPPAGGPDGGLPTGGMPAYPVDNLSAGGPSPAPVYNDPLTPPSDPAPMSEPTTTEPTGTDTANNVGAVNADELIGIKQDVLQQLSPLVGHLEQTPEEKFRTTMMMIQATDDHTLVKTAFDTAKLITDDKARAQAFLDVINEINYFTQQK